MFTGIIKGIGTVKSHHTQAGLSELTIECCSSLLENLETGASIAIDGCCLTVVTFDSQTVSFQLIAETLEKTTLGALNPGDHVNLERSLSYGDEIGGHVLSGHVHGTVEIVEIKQPENNHVVVFQLPEHFKKYFFSKGFIALNGASLTLVNVDLEKNCFEVHLIPETLARTTFAEKKVGDKINFEIDQQTQTLVETAERLANRNDHH